LSDDSHYGGISASNCLRTTFAVPVHVSLFFEPYT
jgi:hypothetical protein